MAKLKPLLNKEGDPLEITVVNNRFDEAILRVNIDGTKFVDLGFFHLETGAFITEPLSDDDAALLHSYVALDANRHLQVEG